MINIIYSPGNFLQENFYCFKIFYFRLTQAEERWFAGVLCGVCWGPVARQEIRALLFDGLTYSTTRFCSAPSSAAAVRAHSHAPRLFTGLSF